MHTMQQPQGLNVRAVIAALLAAGLVGLFGLMLINDSIGTADGIEPHVNQSALPQGDRYPILTEKFAPGHIHVSPESNSITGYLAPCHGEGLMDPEIQALLLGPNETVAQYCEPSARIAGIPDTTTPEMDSSYPEACSGEGLLVPMDPAAQNDGPGSLAEFCTPEGASPDESTQPQQSPQGEGLTRTGDY